MNRDALIVMTVLAVIAVVLLFRSVVGESFLEAGHVIAMENMSDEQLRASIIKDPAAAGYSAYGILERRESDVAIREALEDVKSDDPYVWLNAATYLGSFNRPESVPYLIKALRHTAARTDPKTVEYLLKITGESFGADFEKWHDWYLATENPIEIDWESNLGIRPRLPSDTRK